MIEAYTFGKITVGGKAYRSDVIIFPDRVKGSWWRKEGHNLCIADIQEVLDYNPEILVVGTGNPGLMQVPADVRAEIESRGIRLIIAATRQAVKEFNDLCGSTRVVAALHLTC